MSQEKSDAYRATSMMLALHDGVFVGEIHDESMAPDFLITHMAAFKAQGVTTIYMEMDHQRLAARMIGNDCLQEYYGTHSEPFREAGEKGVGNTGPRENNYYDVMREAAKHGIRIIGTERSHGTAKTYEIRYDYDSEKELLVNTDIGYQVNHSVEAMRERDLFTAEVVRQTRDGGKYIVYGGAAHSRQEGADLTKPSSGVDDLLNIPSIDFIPERVRSRQIFKNLRDDLTVIPGTFVYAARWWHENISGNLSPHSVAEYQRDGTASFVVTNFAGDRYPERDKTLTDDPKRKAGILRVDVAAVGQAMHEAGVCDPPPEGKLVRTLAEVSTVVAMAEAQYPGTVNSFSEEAAIGSAPYVTSTASAAASAEERRER